MSKKIKLPFGIDIIQYESGGAAISASDLLTEIEDQKSTNAVESLLLALAANGVDMGDVRVSKALIDAVEAIANHLEDDEDDAVVTLKGV